MTPLPCPFCGKPPEVRVMGPGEFWEARDQDGESGNAWGFVRCSNKRCVARPYVGPGVTIADDRGVAAYNRAAVRRWNRRAS